jgi:hypothetical protein
LPGNLPVMCTLADSEMHERDASLLARFKSGVIAAEELADGYSFCLAGDGKWLAIVAELIIAERECCRFLKFELLADPQMGPLTVRITGPDGTKAFLKTALVP